MRKILLITLVWLAAMPLVRAQGFDTQTSGEIIFSFADVQKNALSVDDKLRFSMFYHHNQYFHYDFTNNIGLVSGVHLRNVGFITQNEIIDGNTYSMVKRRSYTAGLSAALKLGSFRHNSFVYGGAEYEWLFHYKEKWFEGDEKVAKITDWFSDRTRTFVPSFFVGIQFPRGINLKFKYYMDDIMNHNFRDGSGNQPYQFLDSQLFYISFTKMFRFSDFKDFDDWDTYL